VDVLPMLASSRGSNDLDGGAPGQLFGFACQPPNSFVWGDEVMKFFLAHPRKGS